MFKKSNGKPYPSWIRIRFFSEVFLNDFAKQIAHCMDIPYKMIKRI